LIPVLIANTRFIIILGLVLTALSFLDNTVGPFFLYSYQDRSSVSTLAYLTLIFVVNTTAQFMLIFSITKASRSTVQLKHRYSTASHLFIVASIALNTVLFSSLIYGAFEGVKYELSLFTVFIAYNLFVSAVIIGALVFRFAIWLMKNRNLSIFLYGAAFTVFFLASTSALATILLEIEARTPSITPIPNPWDKTSTRNSVFSELYRISSLTMFGLIWLATSIMLRNYSSNYIKGVGKKKFWLLVSLPLVYFLVSSDYIINQLNSYIFEYPYLSILFVYLLGGAKQVGGIFFAISFILMSKYSFNQNLKIFLTFSAAGIMMLFSSLQIAVLQLIPYPPFGLITLSIMPISAYLLLNGLYYSARSVAFDKEILASLKNRVTEDPSAFLSGIGSAEWSKNIESTVESIVKRTRETERHTDSELSSEDVQKYLSEVMEEIQKSKKPK
jgi:hypothetical protein